MTVTNPFTLTPITILAADRAPVAADAAAMHVATPYDELCADTTRPAAFALTFVEPVAA